MARSYDESRGGCRNPRKGDRKPKARIHWIGGGWRVDTLSGRGCVTLVVWHAFSGLVCRTMHYTEEEWASRGSFNVERWAMGWVEKVKESQGGNDDPVMPEEFIDRWPVIAEFMASGHYEGTKEARTRSTLLLFAGDISGLKGMLSDRDNARTLWATGETLEGILDSLEGMLTSPGTPWRKDKREAPPKKNR